MNFFQELTINLDIVVSIPGKTPQQASELIDSMSQYEILELALLHLDFIGEEKPITSKFN